MNTREESTIKQDDFWRLINREKFIAKYFNARLQYRIRTYLTIDTLEEARCLSRSAALNNGYVYIQLQCDDKTVGEHAEVSVTRWSRLSLTDVFFFFFYSM